MGQRGPPLPPRHTKKRRYKRIERAKPLWQLIEDLLREVGRDMNFAEIRQESQARGWSDKSNTITFPRAIQDKEGTVFVRTDQGTWDLKRGLSRKTNISLTNKIGPPLLQ